MSGIKALSALADRASITNPETLLIPESIEKGLLTNTDENNVKALLCWGYLLKLSDIIFCDDLPVMIKINNYVFPITRHAIDSEIIKRITAILNNAKEGDESIMTTVARGIGFNSTYLFTIKADDSILSKPLSIRYRVNIIKDGNSASPVLRLNNDRISFLHEIGLSEDHMIYQNMFNTDKGLNIITGPVDSGKTTLLYALLAHFIRYNPRGCFIGTVENPVEGDLKAIARAVMSGWKCPSGKTVYRNKTVTQTDISGNSEMTYLNSISEFLRRNTDIILLGEIRHPDEIDAVLAAVLSMGKILNITMHTDSTSMTLDRLIMLSKSNSEGETMSKMFDLLHGLNMIVSQKLLSTVDHKRIAVREELYMTPEIRKDLQNTPYTKITSKVTELMNDNNATMLHMAENYLKEGRISSDVYNKFKRGYERL